MSFSCNEEPKIEDVAKNDASKIELIDEKNPIVTKVNGLIDQAKTEELLKKDP